MRPLYYIFLALTFLAMVAKNNMTTETIVSTWNDETGSWEEISRTEEESGWDLIYDENGNWVHVYETWTYRPGSLEPEYEVWINDTPLTKTIRDGGEELGSFVEWIWNSYF